MATTISMPWVKTTAAVHTPLWTHQNLGDKCLLMFYDDLVNTCQPSRTSGPKLFHLPNIPTLINCRWHSIITKLHIIEYWVNQNTLKYQQEHPIRKDVFSWIKYKWGSKKFQFKTSNTEFITKAWFVGLFSSNNHVYRCGSCLFTSRFQCTWHW